jgi:iron complex transport system substrate-binding protein
VKRAGLVNGAAVAVGIAISVALGYGDVDRAPAGSIVNDVAPSEPAYRRIASASTVADRLLIELCDPRDIVAFTEESTFAPDGRRFAGRAHIVRLDDVERLVALQPDVLIVHNVADARRVEVLRDAGLTVLDLGPLEGLRSLPDDVRRIARICGAPELGERYLEALERRLSAIARHIPERDRRSAIYVTIYAGALFGGTDPSSYHDVLVRAGLYDAAADRYDGWPQYSTEQLLALDPELIVTRPDMRRAICGRESLGRLRACREGDVYEIDGALLDSPGPGILEAAEAVHAAVYEER